MEDLRVNRSRLTRSNNRRGEDKVSDRIDRVLINEAWVSLYPDIQCTNHIVIGSNHTPLILHRNQEGQRRRPQFWFEEIWIENAECKDVIREAWNEWDGGEIPVHISMSWRDLVGG